MTVGVGVDAGYVAPEMVEVEPGVQVVYDYDEPVYYSDNYYWRFYNGGWYRSNVHNGGWVSYSAPAHVVSIHQTHGNEYTHYRPANYTPRARVAPQGGVQTRDHREPVREPVRNEPTVRDHREPVREPVRNEPTVRDHRTEPAPQPVHNEPTVRDHRTEPAPAPTPTVRDHRTAPPPPPPPAKKEPTVRDHRK